ncbi:hypothetical protein HNQ35_002545 [Cerasibacillus quisquiliarum]|uniref:Uncharacterized protein n=1 Tax=Cerasibacillus quisquiliarum TaxID=227865 RepID=A0A511UZM7_9BACI|nr:hypothetical protein [Cerasibacillus quisquiliarum]MBB5147327.1 hypothetical protein [Cerasibacillus quisquiliarum]GEN32104.1 hypothetical protein CQU01_23420 [Cerasibacillus quisquiliarum]
MTKQSIYKSEEGKRLITQHYEDYIKSLKKEIFPNLTTFKTYDMGHFPSKKHIKNMNSEMLEFLVKHDY